MPARTHQFANDLKMLVLVDAMYKHALCCQERHGSSAAFTGVGDLQHMYTAGTVAYLDLTAEYIILTDHVTVEQEKCLIQQCHRSLAATAVGIV